MTQKTHPHHYDTYKPAKSHYDFGRNAASEKDERRLILLAECQVGKTGAYLHYLQLLTRTATTIAIPSPLPLPDEGEPRSRDVFSWLLPRWDELSLQPPLRKMYSTLFASKYTVGVAKTRTNLVMQSCKAPAGSRVDNVWVETFQGLLRNVSGERIASKAGEELIQKLRKDAVAPFDEQGQSTREKGSLESLKAAIDWDGRFHSQGVYLCACEGLCSPECKEAAKSRSSFGAIPSIKVADLAKTGGQSDGVSGRWGASRQEHRDGEQCVSRPTANASASKSIAEGRQLDPNRTVSPVWYLLIRTIVVPHFLRTTYYFVLKALPFQERTTVAALGRPLTDMWQNNRQGLGTAGLLPGGHNTVFGTLKIANFITLKCPPPALRRLTSCSRRGRRKGGYLHHHSTGSRRAGGRRS